ncbi:VOC family protein [Paenibacillus luteus]|uniref:VOC family protein n=1 Tax=Paenibacillus luteus TaxID=2545753 RepID=UPI00114449F8|nr:VOC family protein [Paenibacillus luteus]
MSTVTPFLMFEGRAEEAMNYYISLMEDSKVISIKRYGANEAGKEGSVMLATFSLKSQNIMCIDSHVQHAFTFTPSFSLYITCDTEEEINRLYEALNAGGSILMPLNDYSFSKKFGWVVDQFGVSWQLTLPH